MKTPVMETERLQLRPFVREDAPDVFSCWESDPEVARYMFWTAHQDPARTAAWVEEELEQVEAADWYRWAVCCKESGELMGTVLLYWEEEVQSFEVAYNFGRRFWGQGFATEAMGQVLCFAQEQGLVPVVGRHAAENPASGRVLEKLGFRFVGEIPYECGSGQILAGRQYRWTAPLKRENE